MHPMFSVMMCLCTVTHYQWVSITELQNLNMIYFMLFIPCIFLQLIYWPTNTLSKTHFITSINLLRVSALGFFSILHRPTPNTSSRGDLFRSQRSRRVYDTVWLLWNNYSSPHIAAMWVFPQKSVYNDMNL
jgi:hypothetical protein